MISVPTTGVELAAARGAPDRLLPLVAAIASRHRLGAAAPAAIASGSFPVFFLDDGLVLKLVPDRWRSKLVAEIAALRCFAGAPLPSAVPAAVAEGEVDGWHYLVMTRVPGRALSEIAPSLAPELHAGIVRDLGALMRAMHTVAAPPQSPLHVDWQELVRTQVASATARHADGAPSRWIDAIPELLSREAPRLLVHRASAMSADLHGDHLLVGERDGRLALTGVIDFGDAILGDPDYDFVTPAAFIVRGRPALMTALLDGYDVAATARTPELRARLFAYELLHRFSQIAREVKMLAEPRSLETLGDVERALFPFGG